MKYFSTKEISRIWNISPRRIVVLCEEGRIPGAMLVGRNWVIPENSEKPSDRRTRSHRDDKHDDTKYRFPLLYLGHYSIREVQADFSIEEKKLYRAQMLWIQGDFDASLEIVENLRKTCTTQTVLPGIYYCLCNLYLIKGRFADFERTYIACKLICMGQKRHRKEAELITRDFETLFKGNTYFNDKFKIDPEYVYDHSAEPFLILFCGLSAVVRSRTGKTKINPAMYEIAVQWLEHDGFFYSAHILHSYVASMYMLSGDSDAANHHIERAIEIASEKNFAASLARVMILFPDYFTDAFEGCSEDFKEKTLKCRDIYRTMRNDFEVYEKNDSIVGKFNEREIRFVSYSLRNLPNDEIASYEKVSPQTVSVYYSKLYAKFGVNSKKKLNDVVEKMFFSAE